MNQATEPGAQQDKKALRRQLRAQRRSLAPQRDRGADAEAIAVAASAFLDTLSPPASGAGEHPAYSGQPCVAIYRSTPVEPPTEALADMLHARGVSVIVPETLPDMDLEWRELRADGSEGPRLGLGAIGAAYVILTPAQAVDHAGTRLGQGGGCYDRSLARRPPPRTSSSIPASLLPSRTDPAGRSRPSLAPSCAFARLRPVSQSS